MYACYLLKFNANGIYQALANEIHIFIANIADRVFVLV